MKVFYSYRVSLTKTFYLVQFSDSFDSSFDAADPMIRLVLLNFANIVGWTWGGGGLRRAFVYAGSGRSQGYEVTPLNA